MYDLLRSFLKHVQFRSWKKHDNFAFFCIILQDQNSEELYINRLRLETPPLYISWGTKNSQVSSWESKHLLAQHWDLPWGEVVFHSKNLLRQLAAELVFLTHTQAWLREVIVSGFLYFMVPRRRPWTNKEHTSVLFRSALSLRPPRGYSSAQRARRTGGKPAPQKEKNQATLQTSYAWRRRLMWEAAVALQPRLSGEVRLAWAAEPQPAPTWQQELTSPKRSASKSQWNLVWGVWWRKIRCNFTPPASHLVEKLQVEISGGAKEIWRWIKMSCGIDAGDDFDQ